MSFLILVLYMLRLQNPGDLNTAPKIFKDGVVPELMMLRTLEILHAGRELGLGLQVFLGCFSLEPVSINRLSPFFLMSFLSLL